MQDFTDKVVGRTAARECSPEAPGCSEKKRPDAVGIKPPKLPSEIRLNVGERTMIKNAFPASPRGSA